MRPSSLLGIYVHADGGLNVVYHARLKGRVEVVVNSQDVLSAQWFAIADALALPEEQVLRPGKLRAILADLQEVRFLPCDAIRAVPPEYWEGRRERA